MPPRSRSARGAAQAAPSSAKYDVLLNLAQRVAEGDDNLSAAQLAAAAEVLAEYCATANWHGTLLLTFIDTSLLRDVIALYALALRRSCALDGSVDDARRAGYRKLRGFISGEVVKVAQAVRETADPRRQRLVLSLVLSTQVLRCFSGLLTSAAQQLKQGPSRRNVEAAHEALWEAERLLRVLGHAAKAVSWDAAGLPHGLLPSVPMVRDTKHDYFLALADELQTSQLLNSWAACFLELVVSGELGTCGAAGLLHCVTFSARHCSPPEKTYLQRPRLCAPLPAVQYLVSLILVRTAAQLDGGATYGMPAEAPDLPLFGPNSIPMRPERGGVIDPEALLWGLEVLHDWYRSFLRPGAWHGLEGLGPDVAVSDSRTALRELPPFNHSATFDLCFRIAAAAVQSWTAQRAGQARIALGPPPAAPAAGASLLAHASCSHIMLAALRVAYCCIDATYDRCGPGPLHLPRLTRLWTVFVGGLNAVMDAVESGPSAVAAAAAWGWAGGRPPLRAEGWTMEIIQNEMGWFLRGSGSHETPCPTVYALLAARAVPCVERLIRCFPCDAMPLFPSQSEICKELLLFGPLEDTAALVTSLAKALQCAVDGVRASERGGNSLTTSTGTLSPPMTRLWAMLTWCDSMFDSHSLVSFVDFRRPEREWLTWRAVDGGQLPPFTTDSGACAEGLGPSGMSPSLSSTVTDLGPSMTDPGPSSTYPSDSRLRKGPVGTHGGAGGADSGVNATDRRGNGTATRPSGADAEPTSMDTSLGATTQAPTGADRGACAPAPECNGSNGWSSADSTADSTRTPCNSADDKAPSSLALLWSLASDQLLPHLAEAYRLIAPQLAASSLSVNVWSGNRFIGKTVMSWCVLLLVQYGNALARTDHALARAQNATTRFLHAKETMQVDSAQTRFDAAAAVARRMRQLERVAEVSMSAARDVERDELEWSALLRKVDVPSVLAAVLATYKARKHGYDPTKGTFLQLLWLACRLLPHELREALLGGASSAADAARPDAPARQPATPTVGLSLTLDDIMDLARPDWVATLPSRDKGLAVEVLSDVLTVAGSWTELPPMTSRVSMDPGLEEAAAWLVPPEQARWLIRDHCCGNPACTNLDGPSERSLPRRYCGGACGGPVWYCCKECQAAHWRAGHSDICRKKAGHGADAVDEGSGARPGTAEEEERRQEEAPSEAGGAGSCAPASKIEPLTVIELLD